MAWTNYGDVNPIEHGGMFVKYDEEIGGRNYYVIQLTPLEDVDTEKWAVIDGYVDLDDDWIEWKDVQSTVNTPKATNDEYLATDVMLYYGTNLSNGEMPILNSREEVEQFLKDREIGIEEN